VTISPQSLGQAAGRRLGARLLELWRSRLVRQNIVLFLGGLISGIGSFAYHAAASRGLGPRAYGEVASLVALYTVGTTVNLILVLLLARYAGHVHAAGQAGAIKHVMLRAGSVLALPALACSTLAIATAGHAARFLNLSSPVPLAWAGLAVAACWYCAIPRGVLQGTQRFAALAANLSLEMVVRTGFLTVALVLGLLSTTSAVIAILAGALFACGLGLASLRDLLALEPETARLNSLASFAVTAVAGTLGVILLSNLDVVLAKHYLDAHQAGIYGALNKIGTVLYFLTLSISQVLFSRVIEALGRGEHPGRLLLLSGAIMAILGLGAIGVFGLLPGLVVGVLFGPAFAQAQPYVLAMGVVGLALSLGNLLVQFLIAMHDRGFVLILVAGCVLEPVLIALFHTGVGQVVTDVVVAQVALLLALSMRCLALLAGRPDDGSIWGPEPASEVWVDLNHEPLDPEAS
jgi:O-antigen/teichoic acid export membrane protein